MACLFRVNTSLSSFLLLKCLSSWARDSLRSVVPVQCWFIIYFFFMVGGFFDLSPGLFNGVKKSQSWILGTAVMKWFLSSDSDCAAVTHLSETTGRKDAGHVLFLHLTSIHRRHWLQFQFALSLCNLPRANFKFIRCRICHTVQLAVGLMRLLRLHSV